MAVPHLGSATASVKDLVKSCTGELNQSDSKRF